jgi:selenium metabolism protein YedF
VILTKKALEEARSGAATGAIEVTVDGPTAKENVTRFAAHEGFAVETVDGREGSAVVRIKLGASDSRGKAPAAQAAPIHALGDSALTTVFISSDKIGTGADELGELLMRGFLRTIAESEHRPERVVFMNSGVKLALDDSAALASLHALVDSGVEILSCGTCLDYYDARSRLAVGRVSNMLEISGFLLEGRTLSL